MEMHTCVRVVVGSGRGGGWDWEYILRLTLAIAESYRIIGYRSWIFVFLLTTIWLSGYFSLSDETLSHGTGSILPISCWREFTHTHTRTHAHTYTHTHIYTHARTPSGVRSPTSGKISLNISLKCILLSCSCHWSAFTSRLRVGLWSMIVSFPGHSHFFDQTHMTFRTHLALTFTFV